MISDCSQAYECIQPFLPGIRSRYIIQAPVWQHDAINNVERSKWQASKNPQRYRSKRRENNETFHKTQVPESLFDKEQNAGAAFLRTYRRRRAGTTRVHITDGLYRRVRPQT